MSTLMVCFTQEIDDICWHKISELPTSREAASNNESKKAFWMVAPYILWLKQQLSAERKTNKKKVGR